MDGKFREMQGEARANGAGEEPRSLAREVAALAMLIGQLAERST